LNTYLFQIIKDSRSIFKRFTLIEKHNLMETRILGINFRHNEMYSKPLINRKSTEFMESFIMLA